MKFESKSLEYYTGIADEDLDFNEVNFEEKLRRVPSIQSKWLRFLYGESQKLERMKAAVSKLYRTKYEYYRDDYDHTIKENHIVYFVESDEEYNKKMLATNLQENKIGFIESVVKKLNNVSFDMGNYIKWKMFCSGVN